MTEDRQLGHLWIVGTGRLGPALGAELVRTGGVADLTFAGRSSAAPTFGDPALAAVHYFPLDQLPRAAPPDAILIAVPDDAIRGVADMLGRLHLPPAISLHTSGALGADELATLRAAGWRTGSIHPLVAIPDAHGSAGKLRGAWFGIEGDEEASALARHLVSLLEGRALTIERDRKALYHAAAVMASNYVVALLDVAVGMLERSGVGRVEGAQALGRLAAGAASDVARSGALQALTGPLARGDLGTLELHLGQLSEEEAKLYSVLGREALRIAVDRGLPAEAVAGIEDILREAEG